MVTKKFDIDYAIEIDFAKNTKRPERVFYTLGEIIKNFQILDSHLVESIDSKIQPILLLEDIESGSIRAWLKNGIESIDDDALKNLDIKQVVGAYLVKAKHTIVNFLEGKSTITDRKQLINLEQELLELARETDMLTVPSYHPIGRNKLINGIQSMSDALSSLSQKDKASFITRNSDKAPFNLEFNLTPETIDDLFVRDSLKSRNQMIIKVKKPDYLGDSKWGFRHDVKSFDAKILDEKWLCQFQNRKVDIRPGDSIKARVLTELNYGFDGELVSEKFFIEEIMETIPLPYSKQIQIDNAEKA